jgi:hypothetical protein
MSTAPLPPSSLVVRELLVRIETLHSKQRMHEEAAAESRERAVEADAAAVDAATRIAEYEDIIVRAGIGAREGDTITISSVSLGASIAKGLEDYQRRGGKLRIDPTVLR